MPHTGRKTAMHHCPAVAGWDGRIVRKTSAAGLPPVFDERSDGVHFAVSGAELRHALHCLAQRALRNAAALGALGGAWLSVAHQAPILRYSAATAASCTLCMACFSGERWLELVLSNDLPCMLGL